MKRISFIILIVGGVLVGLYNMYLKPMLPILNGYAAKNLCSCVFVMGVDPDIAKTVDLGFEPITLSSTEVDLDYKTASASFYGLATRKAVYREGLGCVLVNEIPEKTLLQQSFQPDRTIYDSLANWFDHVDTTDVLEPAQLTKVEEAIGYAFDESSERRLNTRAVVVVYKGQLVAERYDKAVNRDSRLMGWSMTKSLTATMVGLLIRDGGIALDDAVPIPFWSNDERSKIRVKDLLQMSSGLEFWENYAERSDANIMLWERDSTGLYAAQKPADTLAGEKWYYSSGTTNLMGYMVRPYFDSQQAYLDYLNQELFNKIGAYSMLIEVDGSGNFVGSSFGWATARDWAKVGQLYLNGGSWNGEQILTSDWVEFVQRPVKDSKGIYGGQFWLNKNGRYKDLPLDTYSMDGFHGQKVFIIPSKELVIVRLGVTYDENDFDFNEFGSDIIQAIEGGKDQVKS